MSEPPQWSAPGGAPRESDRPPGWGSPPPGPGWGPPPGDWSPAARPGVVPLRPLSVGELLDGAFAVLRRQPRTTLAWAAAILVGAELVSLAIRFSTGNVGAVGQFGTLVLPSSGLIIGQLLAAAVQATAAMMLTGVIAVVVADATLGRSTSFGQVWGRVRPRFVPLLGASVIAGVLPYLGLVAFVVPGLFLWGALALTTPALVLERCDITTALRRSWQLAVPAWWRVWGTRAIATLIAGMISLVLNVPAIAVDAARLSLGSPHPTAAPLGTGAFALTVLFSLVANVLTQPFVAAVTALLYVDRRMRAEGLDLALAAAARDGERDGAADPLARPAGESA